MQKLFFCFLFFISAAKLFAIDDSTYHRYNPLWTTYMMIPDVDGFYVVDTSLNDFQRYNFAFDNFQLTNGNFGSPYFHLQPTKYEVVGFDLGMHQFDEYVLNLKDLKFYNTKKPFTQLRYVLGLHNEQMLTMTHTQNIGKNANAAIYIQRIGSEGAYKHQRNDIFNIAVNGSFKTKNNRYQVYGAFIHNNLKSADNGGVNEDSVFTNTHLISKDLANVFMDSAEAHWESNGIYFYQVLNFGKAISKKINDTTIEKNVEPKFQLVHSFSVVDRLYSFTDDSTDFGNYQNTAFYNQEKTIDAWSVQSLKNELKFESASNSFFSYSEKIDSVKTRFHRMPPLFNFSVGGSHQFTNIIHNDSVELRNSVLLKAKISTRIHQSIYFSLEGSYSLLPPQEETRYNAQGYFLWKKIFLTERIISKSPNFIQHRFYSNHFQWSNSFNDIHQQETKVGIYLPHKSELSVSNLQTTNMIYWSDSLFPKQFAGTVKGFCATLTENLKVSRFHLNTIFCYQQYDNNEILHVPQFVGQHSLYYENDVFKKQLKMQAGFDVWYASNFYAPKYVSETGQYFLQSNLSYVYVPVIDLFFNFKIRSARIFLKAEDIGQNFIQVGWFGTYKYPMPDMSFKLGIDWMLWE